MAAVTSAILAGTAAVSAGLGIAKTIRGNRDMKEAQKRINNYERQTFENTLENVVVPQQMYNLEKERLERSVASAENAALQAGARGVAMLPTIQQGEFEQEQQISANLAERQYQLDLAKAQEDVRIQQMTERREEQELAGLGSMYEAGRQTKWSGLGDVSKSLYGIGSVFGNDFMSNTQGAPIINKTEAVLTDLNTLSYVDKKIGESEAAARNGIHAFGNQLSSPITELPKNIR